MLLLIFILLVLAVVLGLVFWVGSVWFQGYIYSEPNEELYWRAPAAAVVLAAFYAGWALLAYLYPERFDTLFSFAIVEEQEVDRLWARRAGEADWVEYNRKTLYHPPFSLYADRQGREPPTNTEAVKIQEDSTEVIFEAVKDAQGNWVTDGPYRIYRDSKGREMNSGSLGKLQQAYWGRLLANLGLNAAHFVVWLLCVWLLLRFQWHHAFGLAFIFWLLMTVAIVPMILQRAAEASPRSPPPSSVPAATPIT